MNSPKPEGSRSLKNPATAPAKRKRGQPRRDIPRTRTLPRVSELTHALLASWARDNGCFLADAVEAGAVLLERARREKVNVAAQAESAAGQK